MFVLCLSWFPDHHSGCLKVTPCLLSWVRQVNPQDPLPHDSEHRNGLASDYRLRIGKFGIPSLNGPLLARSPRVPLPWLLDKSMLRAYHMNLPMLWRWSKTDVDPLLGDLSPLFGSGILAFFLAEWHTPPHPPTPFTTSAKFNAQPSTHQPTNSPTHQAPAHRIHRIHCIHRIHRIHRIHHIHRTSNAQPFETE